MNKQQKLTFSRKIQSKNIKDLELVLKEIIKGNFTELIPTIIRELKKANDPIIRNELALALRDMRAHEAVDSIIDLISDPKNKGYTGTLVFALQKLNCKSKFLELIYIFTEGGYETSLMVLPILNKNLRRLSSTQKRIALRLLEFSKINSVEDKEKTKMINVLQKKLNVDGS